MITVEIIESVNDLYELKNQWQALTEKSKCTPFQEWIWHYAWWKNIGEMLGQRPLFMTVWDGSDVELILPMGITRIGNMVKWSAAEVSDYCDIVTMAHNAKFLQIALEQVIFRFQGSNIRLNQVGPGGIVYNYFNGLKSFSMFDDCICPSIEINCESYEDWLRTLNKIDVSDMKRLRRRLREINSLCLEEVTDEASVHYFIEQMIKDKLGWLERRGINNIICSPEGQIFLTEAIEGMLRTGIVHLSLLRWGDVVLARHVSFEAGDKYFYYMGAWDYSYKKYAPGRLLMFDLIQYAYDNKVKEFDFLRGEEEYKKIMASSAHTLVRFENNKARPSLFGAMSGFRRLLGWSD